MAAGFGPVGSVPPGAVAPTDLVGTYYSPSVGVLILEGSTSTTNASPARLGGLRRETLLASTALAKVGGLRRETLLAFNATVKVGGVYREVLRTAATGQIYAKLSGVYREALLGMTAPVGPTGDNASVSIIW